MNCKKINELKFDEKLDLFSNGRCSTRKLRTTLDGPSMFFPSVAGNLVTLKSGSPGHKTKEAALAEAREYKRQCREYPRGSKKAKEYDRRLAAT